MSAALKEQEKKVRDLARRWLESGEVSYVIGYERGPGANGARPFFASRPQDADRLVVDETCYQNLTRFLVDKLREAPQKGKEAEARPIGIVVKPADFRSLVELAKENLVPLKKVKTIEIQTGVEPEKPESDPELKALEEMSQSERRTFWKRHLARCVRCYACREACPLCYCEECVFDRTKPYRWNEKSVNLRENLFFHMVRAMHLAGRCINCGECERSCPMKIPLGLLNRFLAKRSRERFGISPGENVEDETLFGSYDVNDPGEEIW